MKNLTIVIFGATGNLYADKLARSLYLLFSNGDILPNDFKVIAFSRRDIKTKDFQDLTKSYILKKGQANMSKLDEFISHIEYFQGDFLGAESFSRLKEQISFNKDGVLIFHVATAPMAYEQIFKNIQSTGLNETTGDVRIMIEKPFGENESDAKHLARILDPIFRPEKIFLIDHYLAKETVRNLFDVRFDYKQIEKIKIIFHESNIVGSRGASYEQVGAFRDVGENHMLEILAVLLMDKTAGMDALNIRQSRARALANLYVDYGEPIVKGQYESYKSSAGVDPDSKTETFFRVLLRSKDPLFSEASFELESGKGLMDMGSDVTSTTVAVQVHFKNGKIEEFKIQPLPGTVYDSYIKVYEDTIKGEQTLFVSMPEIMSQWKLTDELLEKWKDMPLVIYKDGSNPEDIK